MALLEELLVAILLALLEAVLLEGLPVEQAVEQEEAQVLVVLVLPQVFPLKL